MKSHLLRVLVLASLGIASAACSGSTLGMDVDPEGAEPDTDDTPSGPDSQADPSTDPDPGGPGEPGRPDWPTEGPVTCDDRGECCDENGTCCDEDGTCCNEREGWCSGSGPAVPPGPGPEPGRPMPPPFPPECEGESTCCYDDGTCCFDDGTCCYPDGTCCNDLEGWCEGGPGPGPGPGPFPPPGPPPVTSDPWEAPVDLGAPGWRDSEEPLCTGMQIYWGSHGVWSDSRGVFVMVGGEGDGYYPEYGDCYGEDCPGTGVWFNDGTGWELFLEPEQSRTLYSEQRLTGFPGGDLISYGYGDTYDGRGCGLSTITRGGQQCEPVWEARGVSVVNSDLAYALVDGGLIRYADGAWGPYPGVLNESGNLNALWADETSIFAASWNAGQLLQLVDDRWTVLDTRTLQSFSAIWGYADDDVYAGTEEGGLFHYDGTSATPIAWEQGGNCRWTSGIRGIWGARGVTYFHTDNELGRIVDGRAETLASWPCSDFEDQPRITSMWGNGPNELFVAVQDVRQPRQECGTTFLLHYDGQEFHRF